MYIWTCRQKTEGTLEEKTKQKNLNYLGFSVIAIFPKKYSYLFYWMISEHFKKQLLSNKGAYSWQCGNIKKGALFFRSVELQELWQISEETFLKIRPPQVKFLDTHLCLDNYI